MSRLASSPNDQASTLRNLKLLVILLAASNILVGAISVYLLRAVDTRYSELIERTVPALNDLRELMTDTITTMRSTNPILLEKPGANRPGLMEAMHAALTTEQKFRTDLLTGAGLTHQPVDRSSLQKAGEAWENEVIGIIQLYPVSSAAEIAHERETKLRPAFEDYMGAIAKASDSVESIGLTSNKDFTAKTNTLSTIVLGVASWPVLLLLALLLLTVVFVIAMMIAFRGKDLADTP